MPRAVGVACLRENAGNLGDSLRQVLAVFFAGPGLFFETFPLGGEHRALELAEAVVASQAEMLVPRALGQPAAVVQRPQAGGKIVVAGEQDATLAAVEVLAGLEGKHADVSERADTPPFVLGSVGVGRVLDDRQVVTPGDVHDGVHVGRQTAQVDGDDGPGARGDRLFDGGRIDVERIQLDVGKHGSRVGLDNRRSGGDEGERRHDHLVTGFDSDCRKRQPQAGSPGHHRDAVLGLVVLGKRFLEAGDFLPGDLAPVAAPQHGNQSTLFFFAEDRPGGKRLGPHRLSAVNRQGLAHLSGCVGVVVVIGDVARVEVDADVGMVDPFHGLDVLGRRHVHEHVLETDRRQMSPGGFPKLAVVRQTTSQDVHRPPRAGTVLRVRRALPATEHKQARHGKN